MAIFGRKLVGKEVLKREPIGYENFSSKVHKLFGHELEKTAAASTITSSYSIAQPPTNNSEHDNVNFVIPVLLLVLWLSKLKIKSYLKEIFHQALTFHAGHNNCTIHEFLLECNVCLELTDHYYNWKIEWNPIRTLWCQFTRHIP